MNIVQTSVSVIICDYYKYCDTVKIFSKSLMNRVINSGLFHRFVNDVFRYVYCKHSIHVVKSIQFNSITVIS